MLSGRRWLPMEMRQLVWLSTLVETMGEHWMMFSLNVRSMNSVRRIIRTIRRLPTKVKPTKRLPLKRRTGLAGPMAALMASLHHAGCREMLHDVACWAIRRS